MPTPKSDKPAKRRYVAKRRQVRQHGPKSALTRADIEATEQAMRAELREGLAAGVGGQARRHDERLETVESQVRSLDERLGAKLEAVESQVRSLDERLSARLEAVESQVADLDRRLSARLEALESQVAELDRRLSGGLGALASQILGLDERVRSLEDRVSNLLTRDEFYARTDELLTEMRAMREEHVTLTHRVRDHKDRIIALEEIHPGGQHSG